MRNLKRALSLAMASIMILGMMVIGAGAVSYDDFSDKDKIENQEAVNTMVSLGVINGKEDGSYDPTGIVTRAEMAKLIAVMMTGGKDPTLGNISSNFTDTKGNWADAYIAYCANKGIINGRGDGTFGPNEAVSGTAAAKMLLTALGYRSDIEKLTGVEWEINTNVLANKIDLFNGIESIDPKQGLSRDNTAQMIYSAVQANEVEYKNNYGEYSGVIYAQPIGTVLETRFKVIKVEGVVAANDVFSVNGTPAPVGKTRLINTNGSKIDASGTVTDSYAGTYAIDVDTDLVGKRIVIYVKYQNNLAPNAAASSVIGTPILSSKNVIVETNGKLKTDEKVRDAIKGSGMSVDYTSAAKTQAILVTEEKTTVAAAASGTLTAGVTVAKGDYYPGIHQTFIDHNNDGKVDYIIQVVPGLSKVTVYNDKDKKLTLSNMKSIDFVDIANPEDVAKDDYVLVAKYDDTYVLTKAESVTGKVTAFDSAGTKLVVDGKSYAEGAGINKAADLDNNLAAGDMTGMVDGSYTLFLDTFGNVLAYTEDEAAVGNYAIVTASTTTGSAGFAAGKVKLLMSDGTTGTYDVNLLASAKKWNATTDAGSNSAKENAMAAVLNNNGAVNTLVTYTIDGGAVTIGQPNHTSSKYLLTGKGTIPTTEQLQSSRSAYAINGISVMADNSTVFFIKDSNGDYTAVSGLNNLRSTGLVATGSNNNAIYYNGKVGGTNVAKAIYAEVGEAYTSNQNYAYIIDTYTKTTEGNNTIYSYPAVLEDGELTTLKSRTDDFLEAGYVYAYDLNNGGYASFNTNNQTINGKAIIDSGRYAVAVAPDTNLGATSISYPLNNKTQVWNVVDADVADTGSVYTTSVSVNDKVAIVLDSDGNISSAFVRGYISGEMTTAPTGMTMLPSAGSLKEDDGTTSVVLNASGGSANWIDAANASKLQLTLTITDKQTATIDTKINGVANATYSHTLTSSFNGTKDIYQAGAAENGTKIDVTVTVKETDKADRIITYSLVAYNASIAPTGQTGTVTKVNTNSGSITIALKTGATTEWDVTNAKATDTVHLALTYAGTAKVSKVEVTGGLKVANAVAEGTTFNAANALVVYTMGAMDAAEIGTLKITVATTNSGKAPVESTYTFNIAQTPIHTLNIPGANLAKHYVGDSITMSGVTGVGEFYTADGTTFTAKATPFVMPDADVNMDIGYYSVLPATPSTANGLSGTITVDKAYAKVGETVTATVTVSGTATAGSKTIDISGSNVTATTITDNTVTNTTVNGTTGLNVTAAAATAGSFTFTFVMTANNTAPNVTFTT